VSLGRALLRHAPVLLLDEPLGHLESALRSQLRRDLRLLSRQFPATMVHVTHDPAEAMAVGDQVAVLHEGQLLQVGPPGEVLRRPANRRVAELCHPLGTMNFIDGDVVGEREQPKFVAGSWLRLPMRGRLRSQTNSVTLAVAAADVKILPADADPGANSHTMKPEVLLTEFTPDGLSVICGHEGAQVTGLWQGESGPVVGKQAMVAMNLDRAFWFETATGAALAADAG
jgi:ABC-type sugar transport system ATPase subunit